MAERLTPRARRVLAGALVAAALAAPACDRTPAVPAARPSVAASSLFGSVDLAWINLNIAMNEQLLPLLELVPTRSGDPDVQALALQVQAFTDAELSTLRALHDQAGLPDENPYLGRPLPGIVTPEQVAAAAKLVGKKFDVVAVEYIRAHLVQSVSLAHSEEESGAEPQSRALALQIIRTRDAAMSTLQKAS